MITWSAVGRLWAWSTVLGSLLFSLSNYCICPRKITKHCQMCVCVAPSIVCRCLLTTSPALRVDFSVRSCDLSDASVFEGKTATSPTVTCFTLHVYRMRLLIPMCFSQSIFPMYPPQYFVLSIAHHSVPARARRPCAELPVTVRSIPEHRLCLSVGACQRRNLDKWTEQLYWIMLALIITIYNNLIII